MKKKYILSILYIEYEEECLKLFNKMANDGWELVKVGLFFVFEKTNRKLKYQIDYTQRDTEFNQLIKDMGYHYIGSCNTTNFYATEDFDVPNLVSDPVVVKNEKLKHYLPNQWYVIVCILIAIFFVGVEIKWLSEFFSSKYYFYFIAHKIPATIFIALSAIGFFLYSILSYQKRKSILNETFEYKKFHLYDKFIYYELIFTFIFSFLLNWYLNGELFKNLYIIYLFFIFPIMIYLQYYAIPKINNKRNRIIIEFIVVILGLSFSIVAVEYTETLYYPKDYYEIEDIGELKKNRYIYEINSFANPTFPEAYSTVYREFRNEEVMDAIINYERNFYKK